MKVALVHELLTMKGGAEKVLRIVADLYPEAPIYTLLYDERKLGDWFPKTRVRTSHINPWKGMNHHRYLSQFPDAIEAFDFSDFDLIISSSSAFAHGIITNGKPKHLCYVHSPARYLWDRTHDVIDRSSHGLLGPLKRWYLERTFHRLRIWDSEAADRPDALLAASEEVQRRIQLYWRRKSQVVYPPLDDFWFEKKSNSERQTANSYFFLASTLADYKRIHLAIEACNQTKTNLVVAGDGPAKHSLLKIAGPTVTLVGYKKGEELRSLYTNAEATIIPGDEDFGLVPLESLACGTPVIAYRGGGVQETITDGTTGVFFDEPSASSLAKCLVRFSRSSFDAQTCRDAAERFTRSTFEQKILKAAGDLMES